MADEVDPFAQQDQAAAGEVEDLSDEVFDLSDVEAVSGAFIIPNGVYPAQVLEARYTTSKNSGNRMFSLTWGLKLPDKETYDFQVRHHPTFSEKQQGQTKHIVNVVLNGDVDWSQFRGVEIAQRMIGQYARVRVRKQANEDFGDQMTVMSVLPPAESLGGFAN